MGHRIVSIISMIHRYVYFRNQIRKVCFLLTIFGNLKGGGLSIYLIIDNILVLFPVRSSVGLFFCLFVCRSSPMKKEEIFLFFENKWKSLYFSCVCVKASGTIPVARAIRMELVKLFLRQPSLNDNMVHFSLS